ncbi:hypothetical protein Tco_0775695, partial [Tanacetum coccineum]
GGLLNFPKEEEEDELSVEDNNDGRIYDQEANNGIDECDVEEDALKHGDGLAGAQVAKDMRMLWDDLVSWWSFIWVLIMFTILYDSIVMAGKLMVFDKLVWDSLNAVEIREGEIFFLKEELQTPFTYLGTKLGEILSRKQAWNEWGGQGSLEFLKSLDVSIRKGRFLMQGSEERNKASWVLQSGTRLISWGGREFEQGCSGGVRYLLDIDSSRSIWVLKFGGINVKITLPIFEAVGMGEKRKHRFWVGNGETDYGVRYLLGGNIDYSDVKNSYEEWRVCVLVGFISGFIQTQCVLWGCIPYGLWLVYVELSHNILLFDKKIPEKALIFDNLVSSSFYWCKFRCKASFKWDDWLKNPYIVLV